MIKSTIAKIDAIKYATVDDTKVMQLQQYYQLLVTANKIHNLTRIVDENDVWQKHFYDSLLICDVIDFANKAVCDIGTGPGFPGLVLKIMIPSIKLTLIESNAKKTNFLQQVVDALHLTDVAIVTTRAEDFAKQHFETQDIMISRAMAALNVLLEVGVQALKVGGQFICLKSRSLDTELQDLNGAETKLGLTFTTIQELEDNMLGVRRNIVYDKTSKTPVIYPRMYSQIKKAPLGRKSSVNNKI